MKFLNSVFVTGLVSLAAAAPTPVNEKRYPNGSILTPTTNHIFRNQQSTQSSTGSVVFVTETSTISTFTIPSAWAGQTVKVGFWYDTANFQDPTGTTIQVFDSIEAPPEGDSTGSNHRNNHIGTLVVQKGGAATEGSGSPQAYKSFLLPSMAGTEIALQVLGVGNNPPAANFQYDTVTSGLYLYL